MVGGLASMLVRVVPQIGSGFNSTGATRPEQAKRPHAPFVRRWRGLYSKRVAIESEFGRLKHEFGLLPLRVRGREQVSLHADLTILARLTLALVRARAVPLAA